MNGLWGYVKHFAGELRGVPLFIVPMVFAIMFPLEIISQVVRPLTLAVRLQGNISGEDTVLAQFNQMAPRILGIPIPIGLPIMGLALITSAVQALVFTVLSAVYMSLFEPPIRATLKGRPQGGPEGPHREAH